MVVTSANVCTEMCLCTLVKRVEFWINHHSDDDIDGNNVNTDDDDDDDDRQDQTRFF